MACEDSDEQPEEEEEEEEEGELNLLRQHGANLQRIHGNPASSPLCADGDLDVPDEEDIVYAAADFAQSFWSNTVDGEGLRRRRPESSEGFGGGGGNIFDDDFMLGSERLVKSDSPATSHSILRRTSALVVFFLSVLIGSFFATPSKASFKALYEEKYADQIRPPTTTTVESSKLQASLGWYPFISDRSFQQGTRVTWKRYVSHGLFSFGAVALKSPSKKATQKGKVQQSTNKIYEHWYLGVFGVWLPLPYLPQPSEKQGIYGVGACLLGECVCIPDLREVSKAEKARKGCWRFRGGKSITLNIVAVPTAVIFFGWQWSGYWSILAAHTTLSLANLCRGRLWVLLTAPFSHRGWAEIFNTAVMLTNMIDSFDRVGASWAIFFVLFFGGCWVAWLINHVLYKRVICNDKSAFYHQVTGASAGLAAQLVFLARSRPSEKFQFSLYMMPLPISLTAWQSLIAHSAMGFFMSQRQWQAELLSNLIAWAFGWLIYDAWQQHV